MVFLSFKDGETERRFEQYRAQQCCAKFDQLCMFLSVIVSLYAFWVTVMDGQVKAIFSLALAGFMVHTVKRVSDNVHFTNLFRVDIGTVILYFTVLDKIMSSGQVTMADILLCQFNRVCLALLTCNVLYVSAWSLVCESAFLWTLHLADANVLQAAQVSLISLLIILPMTYGLEIELRQNFTLQMMLESQTEELLALSQTNTKTKTAVELVTSDIPTLKISTITARSSSPPYITQQRKQQSQSPNMVTEGNDEKVCSSASPDKLNDIDISPSAADSDLNGAQMDTPRATGFPSRPSITHFSIPNNLTPRTSAATATVAVSIRRSLLDAVIRPPHTVTRNQQSAQDRSDSTRSLFENEQDGAAGTVAAVEESSRNQIKTDSTVDSEEDEGRSEAGQHMDDDLSSNEDFEPIEIKLSTTRLRSMGCNDVNGGDSKNQIATQVTTMSRPQAVATYDEFPDDSASRFSDELDLLNHPLLSPPSSQKKSIHLSRSPILSVLESTDSMRLLHLDDRNEFESKRIRDEQGEACDGSEEDGLELLDHHLLSPKKQIISQSPSRRTPSSPLTTQTISGPRIESNMSIDTEDIRALLDHPLLSPSKQKRERLSSATTLLADSPTNRVMSNDGPTRPADDSRVYSSPSHANLSPVSRLTQLRERMASIRKESASSLDIVTESNGTSASSVFSSDSLPGSNETEADQNHNVESAFKSLNTLKMARASSSMSSLNSTGSDHEERSGSSSPSARLSAIKNRLSSFRASISADVTDVTSTVVTVNQDSEKGIDSPVAVSAFSSQLNLSSHDESPIESLLRDDPPSPSSRLSKILASLQQNDADLE
eukprot:GILJ01003092.1.p1 GENE.GILJ01003092.1~~GILJ01003092.1.p1  ORF type:complete len:830 (-),score=137.28 GILJ01003092.1:180-2669(-)